MNSRGSIGIASPGPVRGSAGPPGQQLSLINRLKLRIAEESKTNPRQQLVIAVVVNFVCYSLWTLANKRQFRHAANDVGVVHVVKSHIDAPPSWWSWMPGYESEHGFHHGVLAAFDSVHDVHYSFLCSAIQMIVAGVLSSVLFTDGFPASVAGGGGDRGGSAQGSGGCGRCGILGQLFREVVFGGTSRRRRFLSMMGRRIAPLGLARAIDIGMGNSALAFISVALQQIVKSTVPLYVCILTVVYLRRPVGGWPVVACLVPIVAGTLLASYGELTYTTTGVLLGVSSAAGRGFKAILNDAVLSSTVESERLEPSALLALEGPCSGFLLLLLSVFWESHTYSTITLAGLAYNFLCGCVMLFNQLSYLQIIKLCGAMNCQIVMNVKMLTLIGVSSWVFGRSMSHLNCVGVFVAFVGVLCYVQAVKRAASLARVNVGPAVLTSVASPLAPSASPVTPLSASFSGKLDFESVYSVKNSNVGNYIVPRASVV